MPDPKLFSKLNDLIKEKRYGLKEVNFTKTKELCPLADEMFRTYSMNLCQSFFIRTISEYKKLNFKEKKYISFHKS